MLKKKCAVGDFTIYRGLGLPYFIKALASKSVMTVIFIFIYIFPMQSKNNQQAKVKFTFLTKSVG